MNRCFLARLKNTCLETYKHFSECWRQFNQHISSILERSSVFQVDFSICYITEWAGSCCSFSKLQPEEHLTALWAIWICSNIPLSFCSVVVLNLFKTKKKRTNWGRVQGHVVIHDKLPPVMLLTWDAIDKSCHLATRRQYAKWTLQNKTVEAF